MSRRLILKAISIGLCVMTAAPCLQAESGPPEAPSLQDLGFSQSQTAGSQKDQELLDLRTHRLKVHHR